jgi:hypothetical protein
MAADVIAAAAAVIADGFAPAMKSDSDGDPRPMGSPPHGLRPLDDSFNHVIVREQKKLIKKNGAEYRLMSDENVVLFAHELKEEGGIVLSPKALLSPGTVPEIVAVVRHDGRGRRSTVLCPPMERPYDDRPAELLGMSYITLPENKTKYKAFRVVIPCTGAHYPITKAKELARLAEVGQPPEKLLQFVNKIPTIAPDGRPSNPFGNVYLVDSAKNFVIYDDRDEIIFMVYKETENTFHVKGKEPFTSLTAFGLSLAIISR